MDSIPSPFSDVSDREWSDLSSLITDVKVSWNHPEAGVQQNCCKTLGKLWNLSDQNRYKLPLTHPSLKLLPLFKKILLESNHTTIRTYVLRCIWYLSRHVDNYCIIGSKELGLLETCMDLVRREENDACYKILVNCSFDSRVHDYLFSDKVGYLEFYKNEAVSDLDSVYPYHVFAAAGGIVQENCVHYLLKWQIPELVFRRLTLAGADPDRWFALEAHCLRFISSLSSIPATRVVLYNCHLFDFVYAVSKSFSPESYRALIILTNLYGDDDLNPLQKKKVRMILERTSAVMMFVRMGLAIIDRKSLAARAMEISSIPPGAVMLRDVLLSLYHVSLLGSMEWCMHLITVEERGIFHLLIEVIEGFFLNKRFTAPNDVGQIYEGGGSADELSFVYALRLLLRLCQCESDEREIKEEYRSRLVSSIASLEMLENLNQFEHDLGHHKIELVRLFKLVKSEVEAILKRTER